MPHWLPSHPPRPMNAVVGWEAQQRAQPATVALRLLPGSLPVPAHLPSRHWCTSTGGASPCVSKQPAVPTTGRGGPGGAGAGDGGGDGDGGGGGGTGGTGGTVWVPQVTLARLPLSSRASVSSASCCAVIHGAMCSPKSSAAWRQWHSQSGGAALPSVWLEGHGDTAGCPRGWTAPSAPSGSSRSSSRCSSSGCSSSGASSSFRTPICIAMRALPVAIYI